MGDEYCTVSDQSQPDDVYTGASEPPNSCNPDDPTYQPPEQMSSEESAAAAGARARLHEGQYEHGEHKEQEDPVEEIAKDTLKDAAGEALQEGGGQVLDAAAEGGSLAAKALPGAIGAIIDTARTGAEVLDGAGKVMNGDMTGLLELAGVGIEQYSSILLGSPLAGKALGWAWKGGTTIGKSLADGAIGMLTGHTPGAEEVVNHDKEAANMSTDETAIAAANANGGKTHWDGPNTLVTEYPDGRVERQEIEHEKDYEDKKTYSGYSKEQVTDYFKKKFGPGPNDTSEGSQ